MSGFKPPMALASSSLWKSRAAGRLKTLLSREALLLALLANPQDINEAQPK